MTGVAVIAQTSGTANPSERQRLGLAVGDQVLRLARLRTHRERPTSYELVVLPLARFPGLATERGVTEDVVALARMYGLPLGRASEFGEVYPPTDIAEHLGIASDKAVLKLDRVVRCAAGLAIEWRTAFFSPDL